MTDTAPNLVWIDLETTGLDEKAEGALVLEFALVVTDPFLNVLHEVSEPIGHTIILNNLHPWVLDVHGSNGLLIESAQSKTSMLRASNIMRNTIADPTFFEAKSTILMPPLCGSSIHFERRWLQKFFPDVYRDLAYRSIDVSSIKELVKRWMPEHQWREPESEHRALSDVHNSIAELNYYRDLMGFV